MSHLVIAALTLSAVLAAPSHYPYPVNPGVGAIYKGNNDETIIAGPDGSKITKESDSAGAINLKTPPNAGAIETDSVAITHDVALNLANTGPNLFTSGNDVYVNPGNRDGFVQQNPAVVNRVVQTAGHIGHDDLIHNAGREVLINAAQPSGGLLHTSVRGLPRGGETFVNTGLIHTSGAAGDGLVHVHEEQARAFAGQAAENVVGHGLAHAGQAFDGLAHAEQAFEGLAHDGRAFVNAEAARAGEALNGLAHAGHAFEGLAHDGQAFVNAELARAGKAFEGLAHNGQAFDGLAHDGQAFVNAELARAGKAFDGLAHAGHAFEGIAHDGQALINAELARAGKAFAGSAHVGQTYENVVHTFDSANLRQDHAFESAHSGQILSHDGLVHSGPALHHNDGLIHAGGAFVDAGSILADAAAAAGDALVHSINEANAVIHSAQPSVIINQPPAVINTAAPVLLAEHPIIVPDVHEHDPKIVEEHVLVGNKIISVPKKVEEDSDLIGPSGTISTRGGDTVISGPSSITIKGDGVVSEIEKQPDVHLKSVEVKPVVPPVVIKPIAPIATIEHTVVSTPVITEARPVLAPQRNAYAETAPILGINPIIQTKLIDGLNPILSHKPAIIKSRPVLATSFANHNAVFGNPLYAPEFLPLPAEPFPIKPLYGPLH